MNRLIQHKAKGRALAMPTLGTTFTLALSLMCAAVEAKAGDFNKAIERCVGRVLDSGGFVAREDQAWNLEASTQNGGALLYLGTTHPNSETSPEYDLIIQAYRQFRPSAVFFEGCCLVTTPSEESARAIHETALVQHLAIKDSIPVVSLEPSDVSLRRSLLRVFSTTDVQLFYLLRDIAQERDRRQVRGEILMRRAEWYLSQQLEMSDALPVWPLRSLDEVDRTVRARWPDQRWDSIPTDWFTPYLNDQSAGPKLFHEINRLENKYRNEVMYRRLAEAVLRGERVFAAVGRSHVALQADALHCALSG